MPTEVAEALKPLLGQVGIKRKWMVYTAALIGFLKQEQSEQEKAMGRVGQADISQDFRRLLLEEGIVKRTGVANGEAKPPFRPPERRRRREPDGHS